MIRIGIIGGGQLALMLVESILEKSFIKKIIIYSDKEDVPCKLLKNESKIELIIKIYNEENMNDFSKKCDIITYEFENIDINLLKKLNIPIYPDINILEIIQDKYIQKRYLNENNLSVVKFDIIRCKEDIYNFINLYDYPVILKSRRGSFDGRGNIVILNENELNNNLREIKMISKYYIEKLINFDNEISICGCKDKSEIKYYEPVKNIHKNSILLKTIYNKEIIKDEIKIKIKKIYKKVLELFNTKGLICIEFFNINNDIYINEIALRVHNTYHISLDCCNISQFEMHMRNILDMDIIEPKFINNGIMYNLISNMQNEENLEEILNDYEEKNIKKKLYNKKEIGVRKIGHINILL